MDISNKQKEKRDYRLNFHSSVFDNDLEFHWLRNRDNDFNSK